VISGHRNLPLLLLRTREAAMGHFRPILKRFGLTDQQWRIARALREAPGGLPPGQLADLCKILPPSITGILSRMADLGLVERARSAVDQRRQQVSLTRDGRALVDRILPLVEQQYRLIEAAVGAETLEAAYRTLDAMLALLAQPIPSAVGKVAGRRLGVAPGAPQRGAPAADARPSRGPRRKAGGEAR
jgi:homoprotocatechuate degradation regulator HpaR